MSVSYTESRASRILCDCLLAAESSLTGGISERVRRRILGDSVAEVRHFEASESACLAWHVTACLAGSHEIETFSGGKNYQRRRFLIIFDFLARTFSAVIAPLRTSRLLARINFRFARHSGGISATVKRLIVPNPDSSTTW